ncbi:MAG: type II toxin-antitoxin system VapC family toxin [Planctomycetes bacterium]|nr:type II toxin-antitoxin system VapC family toxin [Planctomycetota bacterium]
MKPIFLDTVGLIALWDTSDQWHLAALPVFSKLLAAGRTMVTSSCILLECGNAAARRPYRLDVDDLRNEMLARGCLFDPTPDDLTRAWDAYRAGYAGDAGIVDQISFVMMRRLSIDEAFTNDRHFRAAGFTNLF